MTTSNHHAQTTPATHQETQTMASTRETDTHKSKSIAPRLVKAQDNFEYVDVPAIAVTGVSEEKRQAQVDATLKTYLTRRDKLEAVTEEMNRLKKTLSALEQQKQEADAAWRLGFVKALGKQSKSMRDQLKQKTQWKLEAEQTKEMIAMLEPQAEWLKLHTYTARQTLTKQVQNLNDLVVFNRLLDGINGLTGTDSLHAIAESVPRLFHQIDTNICNNHLYMASFGMDVHRQSGTAIYSILSDEVTREVKSKVHLKQMAALGELLMRRLPKGTTSTTAMKVPGPLGCEASSQEIPGRYAFQPRLTELESQMEYVPSLEELDSDNAA
ncbi:hypothetical protein ACGLWX_02835 [Halomonas sp. HMF6819]|uniref:hypothetical protein n=1 Tax=Halomonas sp. HMF6819 TaxID=3373085 RepID=UPI0037A1381E